MLMTQGKIQLALDTEHAYVKCCADSSSSSSSFICQIPFCQKPFEIRTKTFGFQMVDS